MCVCDLTEQWYFWTLCPACTSVEVLNRGLIFSVISAESRVGRSLKGETTGLLLLLLKITCCLSFP